MCEYFIQLDNWNYFTVYFSDVTLEEMLCLFGLLMPVFLHWVLCLIVVTFKVGPRRSFRDFLLHFVFYCALCVFKNLCAFEWKCFETYPQIQSFRLLL
jgi:hypothetical protein